MLAREDAPGDKRLVAYSRGAGCGSSRSPRRCAGTLRRPLPDYMVPAAFVRLDALPLTANGKVDRRRCRPRTGAAMRRAAYARRPARSRDASPRIWAEVLGVERVGLHDNFFELGGHSLLAVRLLSRTRAVFKTNLPLSTIFHSPTIAAVAQ